MADEVLNQFRPTEEAKAIDTSKKLRVGIIGTGWIAESHVESYKNMPDCEVVALADIIPGKAAAFAQKFGVPNARIYGHHSEMLAAEELDAVSVCTYNMQHACCTIDCLKKGIPVLLEKPMCVTLEEAVAIRKAEKESGKFVSVGFQPRFDRNMQMVKQVVQSGELGKVYYIQTGGGRRRGIPGSTFIEKKTAGVGALGDIGCYSLDMVLNAIGYPKPLTVSAYTSNYFGTNPKEVGEYDANRFNVDEFAAAFIRLEGDIVLDFRISWAMNINTPGDSIILGTDAGLRIPSTDCWNGSIGGPFVVYRNVAGIETDYSIPERSNHGFGGLFDQKIRSFLDAVKTNGPAPVPTSEIIYNQAIIDGIVRSAELGREVEINIPEF